VTAVEPATAFVIDVPSMSNQSVDVGVVARDACILMVPTKLLGKYATV